MNVLIFPTDDRSGQASLIFHYNKLGHRVFLPKHGSFGLNWNRIATWPALLCKSTQDPTKRNLEIHGFVRPDPATMFGEDFFLTKGVPAPYEDDVTCELIDESFQGHIDVFHTLRGAENHLATYFAIAAKKFPDAKWVSSTFNQHTSTPGGFQPKNAAKLIPAPYEDHHLDVNNVCLVSHDFEARLLGVDLSASYESMGHDFASFNHNFADRQPSDFRLFTRMNEALAADGETIVHNFGGNIRTQGADIRFTGEQGITGRFETLTPPQAYILTKQIIASVHFKADDWGGGVFYYSMNCETPIITTQRYIDRSNSSKYLINEHNCVVIETPEQAAKAVKDLRHDIMYAMKLSRGMLEMKEKLQGPDYWKRWETFLEGIL